MGEAMYFLDIRAVIVGTFIAAVGCATNPGNAPPPADAKTPATEVGNPFEGGAQPVMGGTSTATGSASLDYRSTDESISRLPTSGGGPSSAAGSGAGSSGTGIHFRSTVADNETHP
jgi:hypothetical protein